MLGLKCDGDNLLEGWFLRDIIFKRPFLEIPEDNLLFRQNNAALYFSGR